MSIVSVRSLLLNGQAGPRSDNQASPQTNLPASPLNFPIIRARAATETVYKILVQSLQGAPTTAALTFGFDAVMSTTHGETTPSGSNTQLYSYTDVAPRFQAITYADYPDLLPDGPIPTTVADQTTAADLMLIRRIKGGFDHRLKAIYSFTGGTNPAFILTVECEVRY